LVTSSISPICSASRRAAIGRAELYDNTAGSENWTITAGFNGYSYWQASVLYGSVLPPASQSARSNVYALCAQIAATTK
jgi:hypothetical protein